MNFFLNTFIRKLLFALFLCFASGCSVQLIADYDHASLSQMEQLAKKIDRFYIGLSYLPIEQRNYESNIKYYMEIDIDLNALKHRQEVRVMNELTMKQVENVIKLWKQDKMSHKKNTIISDFSIKRHSRQYYRLFLSMIKGEEAKPRVSN
ncbi:hypothetical protein [Photobacterium lipolyticum]|uniref:Uncharacterized protein n=1 Tax=Photobacterium lipolyticum TaxID=266810 RepID=A0A2T3N403_9GAMM|nr:hypothetical protein [Photobacterium lipolyticum]PSW07162.1 hypothetical protein C9I89_00050 [Photobacterium lipolyticum]